MKKILRKTQPLFKLSLRDHRIPYLHTNMTEHTSPENPLREESDEKPPPQPYELLQSEEDELWNPFEFSDDDDLPVLVDDNPVMEIPWNVSLRPFDLDDVDDFMEWASDDHISEFNCGEEALDYIVDHVMTHPWYRAICLENRPIGSIFFSPGSGNAICRGELGYHLGYKYRGQDMDTLAVKMVTADIFREFPHLARVEAVVDIDDLESQKVYEKAGFMREGILNSYLMVKGRARDMVIYSFISGCPIERLFIFHGDN